MQVVRLWECDELLYEKMFYLRLTEDVYKSYVRPTLLYVSEAWCMKESLIGILGRTERSIVRAVFRTLLKYIKKELRT